MWRECKRGWIGRGVARSRSRCTYHLSLQLPTKLLLSASIIMLRKILHRWWHGPYDFTYRPAARAVTIEPTAEVLAASPNAIQLTIDGEPAKCTGQLRSFIASSQVVFQSGYMLDLLDLANDLWGLRVSLVKDVHMLVIRTPAGLEHATILLKYPYEGPVRERTAVLDLDRLGEMRAVEKEERKFQDRYDCLMLAIMATVMILVLAFVVLAAMYPYCTNCQYLHWCPAGARDVLRPLLCR